MEESSVMEKSVYKAVMPCSLLLQSWRFCVDFLSYCEGDVAHLKKPLNNNKTRASLKCTRPHMS